MSIKTALNHVYRYETRIRDYLNPHFSHEQSLGKWREIMREPAYKRLPSWATSRLQTVFSERVHSAHYFGALAWCLWINPETGEHVGSWDDLPEEVREDFRKNKREGFHYWVSTKVRF